MQPQGRSNLSSTPLFGGGGEERSAAPEYYMIAMKQRGNKCCVRYR